MSSYSLSAFKIRLIYSIINDVFNEDVSLDKAYSKYFHKLKLEAQEQALIVNLTNDVFRRLNYYTHIAGYRKVKDIKKHINKLICAIHVVHHWPVPRLPECEDFSTKEAISRMEEADDIPNLKYGCPQWLDELGQKELGEKWETEKQYLSTEPRRFIRVNRLKISPEELITSLAQEKIRAKTVPDHPDALEILSNASIFRSSAFKNGFFEQQDIGSQEISAFLQVAPGMKVIDACAGVGGKTLHLSALMRGKGVIIAMDDKEWKLKELKTRAKRAGAFNIETRLIDTTKVIKRQHGKADRVLLDVPCSGTGVLKRNPEGKWSDASQKIAELVNIQADILERYSKMTKKDGYLVYSTCSILPSEDHEQVAKFLTKNNNFVLEEEKTVFPSEGGDGFYMARLKKIADAPESNATEE